jgi:hypothetical protein
MAIALAIGIPILLLIVIILTFWFHYAKQKMYHERQVLALQKGLPVPPELPAGPPPKALGPIAVVVPVFFALVGLGVTIWAWNQPWPAGMKWDVTGIAFLAAGWTACIFVSTIAVIVSVNMEIAAARAGSPQPMPVPVSRIPAGPPEGHNP